MRNIIYVVLGSVLTFAILLISSCDDFLSPTIEIFNKLENTTSIEHNQEYEKNKSKKVQTNQQQNKNLN